MEIVYLGLLSSIFNAIFEAILSPIFKFLSSLLETVLGWLFDNVLGPLLENVLWPIFTGVVDLVFEILAEIIYKLFASILQIVDAMQSAFNIFAGLEPVTYVNHPEPLPLIEMLFRIDTVQWAVMIITVIGLCLTFMFAVLGTARSMLELDVDNAKPISRVLRFTGQAMVRFALIPITCLFLITMSGRVLQGVGTAMGSDSTTLSRMVFVVASLDANKKDARYNISGRLNDGDSPVTPASDIGITDAYRRPFYTGSSSYADSDVVGRTFNFARFDYLIGFGCSIFLLIVMGICLINFICRIFEVLMLFIASPIFVSTMPLDDGEKFKAWQDMFVAKIFSGFGSVIAMELYMLLCPVVMGGGISFMQNGSTEADYLIRMLFMLGGAWAVIKAGPTITQLLNFQAGAAERETGMSVTAGMMGAATTIKGTASQAFTGIRGYAASRSAGKQASREASNRRIAKRLNAAGGAGGAGGGGGAGGAGKTGKGRAGAIRRTGTGKASGAAKRTAARRTAAAGKGSALRRNRLAAGTVGRAASMASSRARRQRPPRLTGAQAVRALRRLSPPPTSTPAGAPKKETVTPKASLQSQGKARRVGSLGSSGHVTVNTSSGGHHYLGVDYGKRLSFGRDQEDRFQFRVFGMGYRTGKDGKVDKVSLPFVRLKRGEDGFHVSKVKIPGAVSFKRAETRIVRPDGTESRKFGDMYFSDLKPLGNEVLKRRYDADTGKVETIQSGISHYAKNSKGEYVLTKKELLGMRTEYEQDGSSGHRIARVDAGGISAKVVTGPDGKRHLERVKSSGGKEIFRSKESAAQAAEKRKAKKENDQ